MPTNRRILLKSRPEGWVTRENFILDEQPVREPVDGEVLVRNVYMSVDPYMRGRMNDAKSYIAPFELGEPLEAGVVGQVMTSRSSRFDAGDWVSGMLGWEEYSISDGRGLVRVQPSGAPLSYHLGILGMPGMTAWVGLTEIGNLAPGERVFVTAASGAVGSVVGQIAKNLGCTVAGSAGSDEKVRFLTEELGFDAGFNYREVDSELDAIREVCPKGIDVHFENVGGPVFEAALWSMRNGGRIVLCGMIADYNEPPGEMPPGPRGLPVMIGRELTMRGFIVFNYPEQQMEWVRQGSQWLAEGKLVYRETVTEGLENAPDAFIGMLKGKNFGKQIVKIADET